MYLEHPEEAKAAKKGIEEAASLLNILHKKWDECSDTEKIEKLREEIRDLRNLTRIIGDMQHRISSLESHHHSPDGKPAISIIDGNRPSWDSPQRQDFIA